MREKKSKAARIAKILMNRIASNAYPSNRLPSQRRLAEEFSVSRNTIVEVFHLLEAAGRIVCDERRRSRISFHADPVEEKLHRFLSVSHFRPPLVEHASSWLDERRLAGDDDVIDLACLCNEHWDDHLNFDIEARIAARALERFRSKLLSVYSTSGILPLKREVCRLLAGRNVHVEPEEILIVSRRLQAYRLVSEVMLGRGTELWIPDLSLARHYGVGERHTARRRLLSMDENGEIKFDPLWFSKRPKMVFLEPTRPKPAGASIPTEERREIVEEARHSDMFVFEDAYCDLLYEESLPLMASMDEGRKAVILLGAVPTWLTAVAGFSFIVVNRRIITLLKASARRDYLNPEFFTQLCAAELLSGGELDVMLERFHRFHAERIAAVDALLRANLAGAAQWRLPGSFGCIWLRMADDIDCEKLHRIRRDVDFHPGWLYGEPQKTCRHVLLRYTLPLDVFTEGLSRFASLVNRCRRGN